jgi:hypothetical protein
MSTLAFYQITSRVSHEDHASIEELYERLPSMIKIDTRMSFTKEMITGVNKTTKETNQAIALTSTYFNRFGRFIISASDRSGQFSITLHFGMPRKSESMQLSKRATELDIVSAMAKLIQRVEAGF